MTITQTQTNALDELRTVGIARYAAMKSAEKAYADAQERERKAYQYAAEHGEFYTEEGKRVTGEPDAFLMDEQKFAVEFCPLIAEGYKVLFGLDYPVGYTPVFDQYLDPLNKARRAYRQIAADYLRILGREQEAQKIERALNTYVHPKYMEELDHINRQFLSIKEA